MLASDPAPQPLTKPPALLARVSPAWRASIADAASAFLFSRLIVAAAVLAAPSLLPERVYTDLPPGVRFHTSLPWYLDALVRWDGFHYLSVALEGYHVGPTPWETNTPSLPLYPLLMWLLGSWAGESGLVLAGLAVANLSLFAALTVLHRLADEDFGRAVARRTVLYLSVFPTAFFFSALYGESLFVLLVAAFFLALRRQRWALAALLAGLAAVTRVPGAVLAAVYLWEAVRVCGLSPGKLVRPLAPLALVPLVMLPMFAVMYVQVGDPLSYLTAHQIWGRRFGTPLDQLTLTLAILSRPGQAPNFGFLFPLSLVALFAVAGWRAARTQLPSYAVWFWLYLFVILASPSNTPLMSVPRFLLGAFPAFIMLGQWGRSPFFHLGYIAAAAVLLFLSTVVFAQWYWVA